MGERNRSFRTMMIGRRLPRTSRSTMPSERRFTSVACAFRGPERAIPGMAPTPSYLPSGHVPFGPAGGRLGERGQHAAVHPRTRDSHRIRTSARSPGRPFPPVSLGFGGPERTIPGTAPTPSYLRTEDWHQRTAPFISSHGSSIPYRL